MRLPIKAVVINTKGKKFPVDGYFWDDGAIFLRNPRPERYPDFVGLVGDQSAMTLFWVATKDDLANGVRGDVSPFSIFSMLLDPKVPKKKRKTR